MRDGRPQPRRPHPAPQQRQVLSADHLPGEINALAQLLARVTPLEHRTYPVSWEARGVVIATIALALLTTGVFPLLPDTVVVGGWALWGLGGSITAVMEYAAAWWLVEVSLGGVALLLTLYLVGASYWLTQAPKKLQWLMYASPLLIAHNVLVLFVILASWAVVILIWIGIVAIGVFTAVLLLALWVEPGHERWVKQLALLSIGRQYGIAGKRREGMPSDNIDLQLEYLRNQAVAEITRIQDDAMHQLLKADLPETVALEAMRRISTFGLQALRELDDLFRQFDDFIAEAGRTPEQQAWLNDKAAAILLQIQTADATLVAATIQKTIEEYRDKLAHPKKEIPTVTMDQRLTPERQSPWENLLPVLFVLGCVLALIGWFLMWWGLSDSLTVGVIALGITVFMVVMFQLTGLLLVGIVGVLIMILLALY